MKVTCHNKECRTELNEEFTFDYETVMFAPAQGFYATPNLGKNEIRLAYVLNENDLKKAMLIFRKGLEIYMNNQINN